MNLGGFVIVWRIAGFMFFCLTFYFVRKNCQENLVSQHVWYICITFQFSCYIKFLFELTLIYVSVFGPVVSYSLWTIQRTMFPVRLNLIIPNLTRYIGSLILLKMCPFLEIVFLLNELLFILCVVQFLQIVFKMEI